MNLWIILLFVDLSVVSTKNCSKGYHGPLCDITCRYPNYGKDCQSECLCGEEQCDHITGCVWNNARNVLPDKDTPHFLLNSTSVNYSSDDGNYSTGMSPNCSLHKDKGMLISICIFATVFLVIMSIYLKINKKNYHTIKYLRHYREQNVNTRNENSFLWNDWICIYHRFVNQSVVPNISLVFLYFSLFLGWKYIN